MSDPVHSKFVGDALTFDDCLLVPARASVHPRDVDVSTRLTRDIGLNIPLISSPMDTVTESSLAIALAQEGGIGVIHRNLSIEDQTREVRKVKRSESGVILDPVTLGPDDSLDRAKEIMALHNVSGIPIVLPDGRLTGILTRRDLKFLDPSERLIRDVMTRENLVTASPNTTLDAAEAILNRAKVEKLLLVDNAGRLAGLITMRDIERSREFPLRCKDARGRLRVGAAIGAHDYERAERLIAADVDVIVVDSAHGHSDNVIETIRTLKRKHNIPVIGGNIATAAAAADLVDAGADALKVGIGPGAICTTRVVTGVGIPQISAIMDVAAVAAVPVIADGGIRFSGDVTKALAAGAHSVMIGSLFAGMDESPGQLVLWKGRRYKEYRGMGSLGAMTAGSADRYGHSADQPKKMVAEGVEGRVPYRGRLSEYVFQLVGGLRQGMGYCGARDIEQLRREARFVRVTAAGVQESHPHDITITKEPTNYALDHVTDE
ncbi:MAG: IMP dehydrogenase [Phycisphaerae bacterium]|jgi:IMP dehydrogenase|nr:IMP dehydrogenase [Phycisphaerae bacterium]MCZ2401315.1 IMP dehydrogenase [Phycisphaerae bacterium]NUQ49966.1 IMP dehydrogenase [Phycisphaerae bacterium]